MKKFFIIDVPIYSTKLFISHDQTEKQFYDSYFKAGCKIIGEKQTLSWAKYDDGCVVWRAVEGLDPVGMRFRPNLWTPKGFNSLTHELFHCVMALLLYRKIEYNKATEEAHAYLQGWLAEEIMEKAKP